MTKFGDEDKETYDGTEYPFISKSGHLFEFKTDFDANKADLDIKNSAFSDVSTASKVSKAASFVTENDILTTEEPLSSYERCNSEILKDIMLRSMRSSLTRSKELISVITKKQLKESVSVICSHSPFSYTIISSTLFCEVWTKTLICFAYY
uniref:Ground-like domain-containing protein n=1 Tax=Rhabditophanes sp. KR3021 TaxID=114890 RepID=A0AC35UBF9_9BILA